MTDTETNRTLVVGYDGSDAARRALARVRELGIDYRALVIVAVALIDIAREVDAQLLIVGRRGADFVSRTLLGSVAQRIVEHAPCDILVVA
jgi:nucleotide-binding universal stress UspA family protein